MRSGRCATIRTQCPRFLHQQSQDIRCIHVVIHYQYPQGSPGRLSCFRFGGGCVVSDIASGGTRNNTHDEFAALPQSAGNPDGAPVHIQPAVSPRSIQYLTRSANGRMTVPIA